MKSALEIESAVELKKRSHALYLKGKEIFRRAESEGRQYLTAAEEKEIRTLKSQMEAIDERAHAAEIREPERSFASLFATDSRPLFSSFGEQACAIVDAARRSDFVDPRLRAIQAAASGAGIEFDSDGGFLVEAQWTERLLDRTFQLGQILSRCSRTTLTPGKNVLNLVTPDEVSRANGSRWGGLQVYWPEEGGTITGSKPKLRKVALEPKKSAAICTLTSEIQEDSASLELMLTRGFQEEFRFVLEDLIVNGDGAGKPLGILKGPALITVSKESGQSANTIVSANILSMWSRFWAPGRANGIWICNQDIETQLLTSGLTYVSGTNVVPMPLYVPPSNGEVYGRLLGLPVIPVEYCATLGTIGDLMLIDPAEYIVAEKPLVSAISLHVRFLNDEPVFRFTYRVDGQGFWRTEMTPKNGTRTVSPFVALETRG